MKRVNAFLDRRLITILTFMALGLFVGMFMFYFSQHSTLLYGDGRSRLLTARRVFDSLTPGLTQLGALWPPFPQLLFLATVWNDFLFYSGISGSLVSIAFSTIATYLLAKMILGITQSKTAVIVTVLAFVLNPSLLYMGTTPMTEVIYVGLLVITTYFVWKWSTTEEIIFLPPAGITLIAATLTRYDGWFLTIFSAILMPLVVFLKRKSFGEIKGTFFLFSTIALFGLFLWLIYNQVIYGNMLRFAFGEGSTAAYAAGSLSVSLTKGHIIYSTLVFLSAASLNVGTISMIIILITFLIPIAARKFYLLIPILILSTPFMFNIISLYIGQSELVAKNLPPINLQNTRYALSVVPLAAISYGLLTNFLRRYGFLVSLFVILQFFILSTDLPVVFKEVLIGESSARSVERRNLPPWIRNNPIGGLTLISGFANDTIIFDARLPLKNVIYEGSGKYWQQAIHDPSSIAQRIVVSPEERDSVWRVSQEEKSFFNDYTLVFSGKTFRVYDLTAEKNSHIEIQPTPKIIQDATVTNEPAPSTTIESSQDVREHIVKYGESLWTIAKIYYGKGSEWSKILTPDQKKSIHPGDILIIP